MTAKAWYPIFGTIAMWMIHLIALSSLTRLTCTTPDRLWWLHLITIVTGVGALVGIGLAYQLMQVAVTDDSADTDAGRRRFLGLLGLIVAFANLLLIVGEEGMVIGLIHHRCG